MSNPLVQKLEHRFDLSGADRACLEGLKAHIVSVRARSSIIRHGDAPDHAHIIHSGFACRYKALADGGRLILSFLIPGDICDFNAQVLGPMDYSVRALSDCEIIKIPLKDFNDLTATKPNLDHGFRWISLIDESILREWLVLAKCRSAEKQVAHLFCELLARLGAVGLTEGDRYGLPLTQADIGDATGLSTVHVNRMLQRLRVEKLVEFKNRQVDILNLKALKDFAEFDDQYLHLRQRLALI
ncbi:hypothetical protein ASG51_10635 [Methylobacterium sp. Leaf465]|uniref:Crp/Fnr family transcriptional regulator n=1 Tax=Methylobacterium sp. Leaf465 TaxID=1736385 RepID=UPI0006F89E3E|nr:Crp/Fnr family transcriptional regulator [Methylobacterium sp. Leaf465]KQT71390.1 hypothetical protein ASG51_10635 [Methylobacterium sp. Leaf465]